MQYQNVVISSVVCSLAPDVVTSAQIEDRLQPVYDRLGLPAGRLELMTGIRERRFFPPGTKPGEVSARTARLAIEQAEIPLREYGALIHGSVCRDQLEPATAAGVHHLAQLPSQCLLFDVSNACLGLLNGVLLLANMIELGQIRAGLVVGTETGRPLVEGTIDSLLANDSLTRKQIKLEFASLTIGSGTAAIVVAHRDLAPDGHRLRGGVALANTAAHQLCAGDSEAARHGDDRPRMATDSEALLHAGVDLAALTWARFKEQFGWSEDNLDKCITHQVGRQHRKAMLERLNLSPEYDFPTVEFLGNTGAVALPMAAALAHEKGHLRPGDRVAWLGIGSGLSSIMLAIDW